jgi:hypothetical protein
MTDKQIFEIARQHFDFIAGEWSTDDIGLLRFAQEMYDEGYDQACYEATGGQ